MRSREELCFARADAGNWPESRFAGFLMEPSKISRETFCLNESFYLLNAEGMILSSFIRHAAVPFSSAGEIMPTSKYRKLADRSMEAALAAIEIYNKPIFKYREQTFSILMLNAWELLLKARIIQEHDGDMRKIQVDGRRNRSGNPMTIGIDRAAALVREYPDNSIDECCVQNLKLLQEIRDDSIHFYTEHAGFANRVHEVGSASVINFVVAAENWFEIDLRKQKIYLMPLAFYSISGVVERMDTKNDPEQVRKLLEMIAKVEKEHRPNDDGGFAVTMKMDLKFMRSKDAKSAPVVVSSNDPNAVTVTVSEDDLLKNFPLTYAELTRRLRLRYSDFKQNSKYHEIRRGIESMKKFHRIRYLDPQKNNGGTNKKFYNAGIFTEFDKHYTRSAPAPFSAN